MKISSLDELKTKVGHVIVMILLVKMFERSKMVTIATGLDLLSYSVCIFLSSASLYILHNLHRPEQEYKVCIPRKSILMELWNLSYEAFICLVLDALISCNVCVRAECYFLSQISWQKKILQFLLGIIARYILVVQCYCKYSSNGLIMIAHIYELIIC